MSKQEQVKEAFIFQQIDLEELRVPEKPITERVKQSFTEFLSQIFSEPEHNFRDIDDLNAFSEAQIERIVPLPDWYQLEDHEIPTQSTLYIDYPCSATPQIVEKIVEDGTYEQLEPPSQQEILTGTEEYLTKLELNSKKGIMIRNLELWFRRHHSGFDLLRELVDQLKNHSHPVIVTCSSWALEFITEILHIDLSFLRKRTIQLLTGEDLQEWFLDLTGKTTSRKLIYRSSRTGNLIFDRHVEVVSEAVDGQTDLEVDDKLLRYLAGYALGLPKVLWSLWRNALRIEPDEDVEIDGDELEKMKHLTIWVLPWEKIAIPTAPQGIPSEHKIILHTILIHNGMRREDIAETLKFDTMQLNRGIKSLQQLALIQSEGERLQINPIAYPRIRNMLRSSRYLTDKMGRE